jgi:hypothetical protein
MCWTKPASPLSGLGFSRKNRVTMIRNGIEFTLWLVEPGLWKWRFQIGETVTTGKTQTNLMGLAARRAEVRIDGALRKLNAAAAL